MERHPPLHRGVVAIEKGAFWLPSTTVACFTSAYFTIIFVIPNYAVFPDMKKILFFKIPLFIGWPSKIEK